MWRWLASLLAVVLLALAGLAGFVVGTEGGAAWLAGELELLTDGAVRVRGVNGSLADGLQVEELQITAGTTVIRAEQVALRIGTAALLRRVLSIPALGAARIEVTLTDDGSPPEPFRMLRITTPLPVDVGALDVGVLEIRRAESVQLVTGIHLAGGLRDTQLTLARLRATLAGLTLEAAGRADLVPELPLDVTLRWQLPDAGLAGNGTVRGTLAALEIEQQVRLPESVTVSGTLSDVTTAPRLQASAAWESVQREVPGIGAVRATGGRLKLAGWSEDWQATLSAALAADGWPAMQARGAARGDLRHALFDELRLDGAFGAIAARGDLAFTDGPRLRLDIVASAVQTAAFRPGLDGNLSARLRIATAADGAVSVRIADLEGRLMGRPLAGSGDIAYAGGTLGFRGVALRAGPNRLRADGELGQRLAGTFDLDAPQLGILWPDLGGSLVARAKVAGTRARPVLDVAATGRNIRLEKNSVRELELTAQVDQRQHVDAQLRARGIDGDTTGGTQGIGNLDASLQGTLAAHRFEGRLFGGLLDAELASEGSWNGTALRHRLLSARLAEPTLGEWRLQGEPEASVQTDRASIGPHCWEQVPTSLCVANLLWSPQRTQVSGELRALDLQRLDRWLAEDLAVTGSARAVASLDFGPEGLTGSVESSLEEAVIYYTGGDEPLLTPLPVARLSVTFTPADANATLEFAGGPGLRFSARGRMAAPLGTAAPLDAQVEGELPDISPLVPLLGTDLDLAELAGRITLDAAVGGTLEAPQLTGLVRLSGGALALPDVGVKFEAIDVSLLGDGSAVLRLEGSAKAGGPLTLRGEVRPLEEGGPVAWFRVRGNKIDAVRLPDRFVQASPDVTVRYTAGQITTEGSITIPKADVVIRALPETAAAISPDAVVVDRAAPPTAGATGQMIGGEVALVLGRNVRLRAFGLDTLLEGTVKLSQGADGEPRGYGVVRLKEGKFGAYGKELTIERGTLGFAGPLDDPAVDLRASRRVDWEGKSVTAGILLKGTASRPESRVFSDPAMSEADALSYLISGRPLQSANTTDRSAIAGAALSLGVQQASPLTQRLGSAVTLDELGMEGGTLDETEVVAGKQLGSDLYVRFTYGLFNRIGTVLARYKIGRNLSIEAASGEDQSLDLIYSVEKD